MKKFSAIIIIVSLFLLCPAFNSFASEAKTPLAEKKQSHKEQIPLTGPTISMDYGEGTPAINSVDDFMYFVPLMSLTLVETHKSPGNSQQSRITSYKKSSNSKSFRVRCVNSK